MVDPRPLLLVASMACGAPPTAPSPPGSSAALRTAEAAAGQARVDADPSDLDAHNALARHALHAREVAEAIAHNRAVLERDPDNAEALTFAAVLAGGVGLDGRALAILDQVVAADPDQGVAWAVRGTLLLDQGQASEALDSLEKASSLLHDPAVEAALARARAAVQQLP